MTYRLQLHGGFTFDDARAIVPYLAALGVTDCYCSPVFRAAPGSTHGYDVSRHTEISRELGGEAGFDAFASELRRHGIGLMLDFVPNHMGIDPQTNDWWRDVLENGPSSPFAHFFDIDWDPIKPELKDRLLLPILSEQYGETLESGQLSLGFEDGMLVVCYGSTRLPLNPRKAPPVLGHQLERLEAEVGADSPTMREFLSILTALRNLPAYTQRGAGEMRERQREKQVARERLSRLVESHPPIAAHIERAVDAYNGRPGDPASFDRLHDLLEQQPYRLASWRTASDEINYRRFFDINQLAGLRVEDPRVFDEIHRLVLALIASGQVTALRLDHIDGLHDPGAYLRRLASACATAAAARGDTARPPTLIVEKIVSGSEQLPPDWPVAGTTGYTFLNDLNGLFVDRRRAKKMLRIYARFTGRTAPYADVAYECKKLIVSTALSSEFQVLVQAINRFSEIDRRSRDFTTGSLGRALREVVACFPVYRTYVSAAGAAASDAAAVAAAIAEARQRNPAMEASIFDFLHGVLLPEAARGAPSDASPAAARIELAMRFQQYTAPVQAKGVEDTAYYRYHVLASLNEVGGDPRRFGRTVTEFHHANRSRVGRWPGEMLATSTHDTKRGEDARSRINVLSEVPDAWQTALMRWRRCNAPNRTRLPSGRAPDANDEYLFYQALLGAWPAGTSGQDDLPVDFVDRMAAFMHKAIKEAKTHTSWITPNVAYESAVKRFVERSLAGRSAREFVTDFCDFVDGVAQAAMVSSLSQLVLKVASPGVADYYQGTELWEQSLVDPDNRRPIDFAARRRWLDEMAAPLAAAAGKSHGPGPAGLVGQLLRDWPDGRIKLFLTVAGMRARRDAPLLFLDGDYVALAVEGFATRHTVACLRRHGRDALIAVVPRLVAVLAPRQLPIGEAVWRDTALVLPSSVGAREFRNLFTGQRVNTVVGADSRVTLALKHVLSQCPVAMLSAH